MAVALGLISLPYAATCTTGETGGGIILSALCVTGHARYLVPQCDGVVCLSLSAKEALWDRFCTAAPARLRLCVERFSIVKKVSPA